MKLFLDANILVALLNKEYPVFTYAARIASLADSRKFEVFTSPLCLAIAFYFAEKKSGRRAAREKISILAQKLSIADTNQLAVKKTVDNKNIHDFEDGLEYYSAVHANCKCLVTEDEEDFYFSDIEVMGAKKFFEKYML